MVPGKQVLLFIGVLSYFGVDTCLCGRLRRRDGGDWLRSSRRTVPESQNATRGHKEAPPIEAGLPVSVTVVKSVSVDVLSSPAGAPGTQIPDAQSAPNNTGSAGAASSIHGTVSQPEISNTGNTKIDSGLVDSATESASSEITRSLSAVGFKATLVTSRSSSSSEAEDYIDPGMYGASGTLTTDSKVPLRSAVPSKDSLLPIPKSVSKAPTRPFAPGPPPVDDDDGVTYGPGEPLTTLTTTPTTTPTTTSATTSTPVAPVAAPVRTRPGGQTPPNYTIVTSFSPVGSASVDLGLDGGPETATGPQYGGHQNGTGLYPNQTWATMTRGGTPSTALSYCKESDTSAVSAITTWSVVYTSTITWTGDPRSYTPPFPPVVTPVAQPLPECVVPLPPPRLTLSVCSSTGTGTKYVTCIETTSTDWNFAPAMSTHTAQPTATVVFITTDKNPAVVFSPFTTPGYGVPTQPRTKDLGNHEPTKGSQTTNSPPPYNSPKTQAVNSPDPPKPTPPKPVTIVIRPSAVIINDKTISDNPPASTQVVIIDNQTYTIDPTQVVGGGATVTRPPPLANGGIFIPAPTSKTLGGILVVVSSSVAIIDGTSYTIGPNPITTSVSGKAVVINTGGIAIASDTLVVPKLPSPTEIVVAGGQLITAIGQSVVVIHGTTITYGLDGSNTVTTVGDDIITLGPSGITAPGGVTLGGPQAKTIGTEYAVVGGVTLTEIGESVIVINGATYTVGPGAATITTAVSGSTITIGPEGVAIDTLRFAYPFGPASTTVIPAGRAGPSAATASVTGFGGTGAPAPQKAEDDGVGGVARPGVGALICIAIGVVGFLGI